MIEKIFDGPMMNREVSDFIQMLVDRGFKLNTSGILNPGEYVNYDIRKRNYTYGYRGRWVPKNS